ncbi:proteasome assembly chaperone family protein [Halomicroarcula sp. GCM10025709]|uniref:proteasome assembly chaperone family protein n=1 Tax=Haloarcula TaxID=2237 RepID=UPI0024C2AB78|nr:PAC2 family protein [Halomicroarcula sp. YJ-61-S]
MSVADTFRIDTTEHKPIGSTLLVGQANPGMAGVTAVDHLVRHLDATLIGHVAPNDLPAIAPFEDGVPRHHGRLFTHTGADMTILIEELFVPVGAGRGYVDALLDWIEPSAVDEITVLHGVPFPHGPEEHDVFSVATPAYRDRRLADSSLSPLRGGLLDGIVGELVTRSLDETVPETGVLITPTHLPGPDIDAALRLIDALEGLYDLDVDETDLRTFGDQLKQYYEQLASRMESRGAGGSDVSSEYPDDRMFM